MLLIAAVFVVIVGGTYFMPVVLPGLLIVAVGAGVSAAVSKIIFRLFGTPNKTL